MVLLMLLTGCASTNSQYPEGQEDLVKSVTVIEESGGRVSWSYNGEWISIDQQDSAGFYDVYVMGPDKSEKRCLTCGKSGVPQKHNGSPEFHPSGKYIVFTAEKQNHRGSSNFSRPGQGVYNDIWLAAVDGSKFWKIVDVPNDPNGGTVHPHFSKDGKKISWSVMYEKFKRAFDWKNTVGSWHLKSADFEVSEAGPKLINIRNHDPKIKAFYENHGFSNDGSKIVFSGSHEAKGLLDHDLYIVELATGKITNMSGKEGKESAYDEIAQYSPDGTKIVWGTNRNNKNKGMDYWVMDADGTNQKRLTWFNHPTKNKFLPKDQAYTAVDFSFHPDGKRILARIFTDWVKQVGFTAMIDLKEPVGTASAEKQ